MSFFASESFDFSMLQWTSGATYVGEHNMDERTGFGKMVWPDGAEYGGLWRNGVLVEVIDDLDLSQVVSQLGCNFAPTLGLYVVKCKLPLVVKKS